MSAFQDETWAGLEEVAEGAAKGLLALPVTIFHSFAQAFAAPEFCRASQIIQGQFAFGLGFVVAVVNVHHFFPIGKVIHLAGLFRQGFPTLTTAPVGIDMILHIGVDKVFGAMFAVEQRFERASDDAAHQFLPTRQLADFLASNPEPGSQEVHDFLASNPEPAPIADTESIQEPMVAFTGADREYSSENNGVFRGDIYAYIVIEYDK